MSNALNLVVAVLLYPYCLPAKPPLRTVMPKLSFCKRMNGNFALLMQRDQRDLRLTRRSRKIRLLSKGKLKTEIPASGFMERDIMGWSQSAMRSRHIIGFAVAVCLLIGSVPLFAHHGGAAFDVGKRISKKGTVTEWFWANPHCFLSFDVKEDNGQVVRWIVETQAPPNIVPIGFSKQSFKPGDEVTVTLEPVKNGRPLGRLLQVVLPDGKTLDTVAGRNAEPYPDGAGGSKSENYPKQ